VLTFEAMNCIGVALLKSGVLRRLHLAGVPWRCLLDCLPGVEQSNPAQPARMLTCNNINPSLVSARVLPLALSHALSCFETGKIPFRVAHSDDSDLWVADARSSTWSESAFDCFSAAVRS
jgi:hypothetical protein